MYLEKQRDEMKIFVFAIQDICSYEVIEKKLQSIKRLFVFLTFKKFGNLV